MLPVGVGGDLAYQINVTLALNQCASSLRPSEESALNWN